jgi:simple sugar transport system permease protein
MDEFQVVLLIKSVIAGATPIVLATLGETLTEKSGLINLSLDGSILLSAMTAFAVAYETGNPAAGFISAAAVGSLVALVVAVFGIHLKRSQVAVGFVLTLTARDLAYFLGNDYTRLQGPQTAPFPIPLACDIPVLGELFFRHTPPVYLSLIMIAAVWGYMYRTRAGLNMRAVGENPEAAFARGIRPVRVKTVHALAGGFLVGLAGAAFSLCAKPGWGRPQGAEGTGWIALALVIFGGWNPIRAAAGAYLFSFLQVAGIYCQEWIPSVPAQVFQVAPFPLMIFTLLVIQLAGTERARDLTADRPRLDRLRKRLGGGPPAALGK